MAEQVQHHLTIPQYVADFELGSLDARELVLDITTNLRHFCDAHELDYEELAETARMHWLTEREEETP